MAIMHYIDLSGIDKLNQHYMNSFFYIQSLTLSSNLILNAHLCQSHWRNWPVSVRMSVFLLTGVVTRFWQQRTVRVYIIWSTQHIDPSLFQQENFCSESKSHDNISNLSYFPTRECLVWHYWSKKAGNTQIGFALVYIGFVLVSQ